MSSRKLCAWVAAVSLGVGVGCTTDPLEVPGIAADEVFSATLAGTEEVPVVTTPASGSARIVVALDTFLTIQVNVASIDSTTLSHIHDGAGGVNGPVIVTLYTGATACRNAAGALINGTSPRCKVGYTGPLAQRQFTPSQLTKLPVTWGTTPRARFDSLLVMMRTSNVYVNVHNRANPGGHVRGQVQPS